MTKATRKAPVRAAPARTADTAPEKLGKAQLVEQMTETGLSRQGASAVFDAVLEVLVEALKAGKIVGLPGLETFSVRETAARQGVRPGTAEKIQIPAGKKVSYKVALDLKKALCPGWWSAYAWSVEGATNWYVRFKPQPVDVQHGVEVGFEIGNRTDSCRLGCKASVAGLSVHQPAHLVPIPLRSALRKPQPLLYKHVGFPVPEGSVTRPDLPLLQPSSSGGHQNC